MFHWTVNVFRVSLWYSPAGDELVFEGAVCDCDRWEEHQLTPPAERMCEHIARVKAYIKTVERLGHTEDQLIEDSIELEDIEEIAEPPVEIHANCKLE